jgi:hypothetical protein
MANPFDRSAIEPFGADRKAVGRVGRAKLRMRIFLAGSKVDAVKRFTSS